MSEFQITNEQGADTADMVKSPEAKKRLVLV